MNKTRWLSVHVFPDEMLVDRFLIQYLSPFVEAANTDIRRFFFIRHSDDGIHLRIRFLLTGSTGFEDFFSGLGRLIDSYRYLSSVADPVDCRMERVPYDRALLYFGETRHSVYAELLNEHTSRLALRLLAEHSHGKMPKFLAACSTVLAIHQAADSRAIDCAVERSLELLHRALEKNGVPPPQSSDLPVKLLNYLDLHSKSMETAFAKDPTVQYIGRLLIRTRRLSSGEKVCTHAVHLFCNKLGFSLLEELKLMIALQQLLQHRSAIRLARLRS